MNQPQDETDELVRRAAANEPAAIEELLVRHRVRLRQMVGIRMNSRLAARIDPSDIVQEVMIEASDKLNEYLATQPLGFYPWLRRLAWERMMDAYRTHVLAQRRTINREKRFDMPLPDQSTMYLANALVSREISPSQQMMSDQMKKQVQQALGQLRHQYRELLILKYLEQLSIKEIAEIIEISEPAVKMRHMRAMKQLAGLLSHLNSGSE